MARQLPFGRRLKVPVPDSVRKEGTLLSFQNKGFYGNYFDQLLFESHQVEHILGNAAQLAAEFATITWSNFNARFEDKAGSPVVLGDYERVMVIGMDTLTANLEIDNITGLEIKHVGATPGQSGDNPKFQLGDVGGGEPYKIKLGTNTKDCKLDLLTDKPFDELELSNLSLAQKRFIANQGRGNAIKVNGERIYNPSESGQIVKYDTAPRNPYLLRMDGADFPWSANAAVNNLAWFRDLNIALDGQRWDGSQFVETQGRFTPIAVVNYLFRLNTVNRFFTDISTLDTRIHERGDPTGVTVFDTAGVSNGSNVVTFVSIADIKNNMRISGLSANGIPDGAVGTTILKNINTTTNTAEMFDALTGAPVNATLSGSGLSVTMDNSGAAGGSHDADAFQNITGGFNLHKVFTGADIIESPTGAFTKTDTAIPAFSLDTQNPNQVLTDVDFDASGSLLPFPARTHGQTQPKSSAVYYYYKA